MENVLSKRTARSFPDVYTGWQVAASRVVALVTCRLVALVTCRLVALLFGVVLTPALALAQARGSAGATPSGGGGWASGGWWIFWIAAAVVAIIVFLAWGKTGGRGHRSPRTER